MEDGAFRFPWGRLCAEGFVEMGIKRLADGVNGSDAVVGQKPFELALDKFQAGEDGGHVLGRAGGLQAELKMVKERKKIRKDGLVGVFEGVLLFAEEALAGIFKVGPDAEELILEGSDFGGWIGLAHGRGSRGRSGLAVRQDDFGFFGGRAGMGGGLGFHFRVR